MSEKFRKTALITSLFLFWMILAGEINGRQVFTGIIVSFSVVFISIKIFGKIESNHVEMISPFKLFWFFSIVIFEIFLAAYAHIVRVIKGEGTPKIYEVVLNIEDEFSIVLISNAITLTPGTITLKIEDNIITVLGFADSEEEIVKSKEVILNRFQKPFLGR